MYASFLKNMLCLTFQEASVFLEATGQPDSDAGTRGQQKQIQEIMSEKPTAKAAKKARFARDTTMKGTTEVKTAQK